LELHGDNLIAEIVHDVRAVLIAGIRGSAFFYQLDVEIEGGFAFRRIERHHGLAARLLHQGGSALVHEHVDHPEDVVVLLASEPDPPLIDFSIAVLVDRQFLRERVQLIPILRRPGDPRSPEKVHV
jgi:hypothetical protein